MSGKPSHRSCGNMQRGVRKPSAKSSSMPKKEIKKSVNDYNYYLGSAKQASDYEMTTEFLINLIVKTFEYRNFLFFRHSENLSILILTPGNLPCDRAHILAMIPTTKLREHSRTSNSRSSSNQSLMTSVSENELWTIMS
jgi:hypothetical protein